MKIIERKIRKLWLKTPKIEVRAHVFDKRLFAVKTIQCPIDKDYCKKHLIDCNCKPSMTAIVTPFINIYIYSARFYAMCDRRLAGRNEPQRVELDRKDLLTLIAGTSPSREMMGVIQDNTGMGRMHHDCELPSDFWKWSIFMLDDTCKFCEYSSSTRFSNRELLELYIAIRTGNIDKAIEITKRED